MNKTLTILALFVLIISCGEKRVKRIVPGTWTLVSIEGTDSWGFTKEYSGTGQLIFEDCDNSTCAYSINIDATGGYGEYTRSDSGVYDVVLDATNIRFIRTSLPQIDTVDAHIFQLTKTDLKISYKERGSDVSYLVVFSKD